jgi:hypothetical protein
MESDLKAIFIMIIGGVPGVGKSFLSNKICTEYKNIFEIKYLNFDSIENINKDNYLQYQQMRNDYLVKIKEIFRDINDFDTKNLLVILDDNFFLKSMRKKIFNTLMDKVIELNSNLIKFYYLEILLKPFDINYCLKMNLNREKTNIIPDNIIFKMNNIFEYNSPYANDSQVLILNISNEESLNNNKLIQEIFDNKDKYIIKKKKENEIKEKIKIEKDEKAKLIDDIEDILRKEVNLIFQKNKEIQKRGKEISSYKKEYMKIILNCIKNFENEKNIDTENKNELLVILKNCIINKTFNISQNQQLIDLIKNDFNNFLKEKKIYF